MEDFISTSYKSTRLDSFSICSFRSNSQNFDVWKSERRVQDGRVADKFDFENHQDLLLRGGNDPHLDFRLDVAVKLNLHSVHAQFLDRTIQIDVIGIDLVSGRLQRMIEPYR